MTERIVYRFGSFVDFAGNTRKFVACAVSTETSTSNVEYTAKSGDVYVEPIEKVLGIGFSVCRVGDEYNEELGKQIAYNKAVGAKNSLKMFVTFSGMINTPVVNALLDQEIEYFKRNPNAHISGYNEERDKYLAEVNQNATKRRLFESLPESVKDAVNFIKSQDKKVMDIIHSLL